MLFDKLQLYNLFLGQLFKLSIKLVPKQENIIILKLEELINGLIIMKNALIQIDHVLMNGIVFFFVYKLYVKNCFHCNKINTALFK